MTTPDNAQQPKGRILALDLGQKRVGVAICDELLISITRLSPILRTNWKHLLANVAQLVRQYDAKALVIGHPSNRRKLCTITFDTSFLAGRTPDFRGRGGATTRGWP